MNVNSSGCIRIFSREGMQEYLKVNAGDKLTLSARSFYNSHATYCRDLLLPEMLVMLLDGLMNPTGLTAQSGTGWTNRVNRFQYQTP